ncbi:unnamed protein product [Ixodes persulcatus]
MCTRVVVRGASTWCAPSCVVSWPHLAPFSPRLRTLRERKGEGKVGRASP